LLLHLALILVIGGAVIIEQVIPKSSFKPAVLGESFDQQVETETPPEEELQDPSNSQTLDLPSEAVSMPEASPENSIDAITVDSPAAASSWSVTSSTSAGTPGITGTKSGGGGAPGGSGTGKKAVGNIFGKKVEANKLGVILDVSGSAHAFLLPAMKEIDKNFENSPTVLAMGCGMSDLKSGTGDVLVYGKIKADKVKDAPGSRTSIGQLAKATATYKDLEKYLDRLKKRDDVWAIQGGDVGATQLGFEKLIAEGCDTIYWFSDFADALNPKVFEEVLKEVKRKNIKVIAHNFSGKPVTPLPTNMAKETGGDTISKTP
jgi:hypothetical protein